MTFRDLAPASSARGLWLHPDLGEWSRGIPATGTPLDLRGRGGMTRHEAGGLRILVKSHRRGGLLRGLLPDAFLSASRARREARALEILSRLGLSPRCLALEIRGLVLKRMRIAVEEIEGAADLLAAEIPPSEQAAMAATAGRAVRAMHDAGVAHADLNASNILVRREGSAWRAWIVDLDGARIAPGGVPGERRIAEVLRLCRSIDKWTRTASASAAARRRFLFAALPADAAREAFSRARRAQALRRARGRKPRPHA